jgi:hypothetical protein
MVNETNQPYAYAGDDPVNGVDPDALCGSKSPACGQGKLSAEEAAAQAANRKLKDLEGEMTHFECQDQAKLNQLNPQYMNVVPYSPAGIQDENQYNVLVLTDLTQLGNLGLKISQVANDTYTLYTDAGEVNAATNAYANAADALEPLIGSGTAEEAAAESQLGDAGEWLSSSVIAFQSDVQGVESDGSIIPVILCYLFCFD